MTKSFKKIVGVLLILFLIAWIVIKGINLPQKIQRQMYPQKYSEYVHQYSEENKVDPLLTFAIIKAESNFKSDVVSKSNAIGLMQLMESTAQETCRKLKLEYQKQMLSEPEYNIRLGTKYFADLLQKYENIPIALTAYNAGSGNVDKWIEKGTIQKDGSDVENIPYRETNNYVRKILRDYQKYQELY